MNSALVAPKRGDVHVSPTRASHRDSPSFVDSSKKQLPEMVAARGRARVKRRGAYPTGEGGGLGAAELPGVPLHPVSVGDDFAARPESTSNRRISWVPRM